MWQGDDDPVRIDYDAKIGETDDAVLLDVYGDEYWIPKSRIIGMERIGKLFDTRGYVLIPEWLAERKGLV